MTVHETERYCTFQPLTTLQSTCLCSYHDWLHMDSGHGIQNKHL